MEHLSVYIVIKHGLDLILLYSDGLSIKNPVRDIALSYVVSHRIE